MGPHVRSRDAAAARLRRSGTRAFFGAHRALSAALRRLQHAGLRAGDAVQLYYLLRRQMVRPYRKPLIVFTPKSLLRHKESVSPLEEFANDKFRPVNEDWDATGHRSRARSTRVVFCSGKVYYDLRAGAQGAASAICRSCASRSSIRFRTTTSRRRSSATRMRSEDRVVSGRAAQPGRVAPHPALSAAASAAAPEAVLCGPRFLGLAGSRLQAVARRAAESPRRPGADARRRERAARDTVARGSCWPVSYCGGGRNESQDDSCLSK